MRIYEGFLLLPRDLPSFMVLETGIYGALPGFHSGSNKNL